MFAQIVERSRGQRQHGGVKATQLFERTRLASMTTCGGVGEHPGVKLGRERLETRGQQ